MNGWQPGSTAPTDGTMVLVLETPNGEHYNIVPAMFMNKGGGDPRIGQQAEGMIGWWGVCGSRYTGDGGDCTLPVKFKALALSPIAWKPIDVSERQLKALIAKFEPDFENSYAADKEACIAAKKEAGFS